jgi:glycosyltransferase involved in cell wall biosynthesis
VARLVPIKAHEVFFQAAAAIAPVKPRAVFVIVGDGERRQELGALAARLGLADRVRFLGWRADLNRVYADLDVVALTSRNEGSPVALIEAMAAGRPVVSTRVGGVEDLIVDGEHGLLCPMDDAASVAAQVTRVLDTPDLRARVRETYSAPRLLDDVDVLYGRLLDGARERGIAALPPDRRRTAASGCK